MSGLSNTNETLCTLIKSCNPQVSLYERPRHMRHTALISVSFIFFKDCAKFPLLSTYALMFKDACNY